MVTKEELVVASKYAAQLWLSQGEEAARYWVVSNLPEDEQVAVFNLASKYAFKPKEH